MTRRINDEGLKLIKQWEGLKTEAYKDVAGIWTIGYGHTSSAGSPQVKAGMKISEQEAEAILKRDLSKFESRVDSLVKVPLTDNQFAVLVSFDFNTGKLHSSTLLKKLNKGDYEAVPKELMKWVNAGGKKVKGLVNRRAAECGLWAKGEFVSSNYVEAKPEEKKTVQSKEVQGASLAGVGVIGSACTEAATNLIPYTDMLPVIKYIFAALTLTGIGFGLWASVRRIKESNA